MSNDIDIDRFVKDPSLLIELCREVVDRIDSGFDDPKAGEKEAQLLEIAKAVKKLEKIGVPVPDALRGEKTRLAAELGTKTKAAQALHHMADELDVIIKDLNARLGRGSDHQTAKKPRGKRSRSPKTDKETLRTHIVRALRKLGGRARVAEVLDEMEQQLAGKLLPCDLAVRQDGKTIAWKNNAQWERLRMTHDGVLRNDSPNGIWELSEEHR